MYTVTVRGHMMIAHSLRGSVFGPAQQLHGATYVVDVELRKPDLDSDGIIVDIGRATGALHAILAGLSYRNLDEDPAFEGRNTAVRGDETRRSWRGRPRHRERSGHASRIARRRGRIRGPCRSASG